MTRKNLVRKISKKLWIKYDITKNVVEEFIEEMYIWIKDNGKFGIDGFGTFKTSIFPWRETIDLNTWEKSYIKERKVVRFKPWKVLKTIVK